MAAQRPPPGPRAWPSRRVPRATQEQPRRRPPRCRVSVGGIRRCRWQSLGCHRGHQSAAFRTVGRSEPLEMLLFPLGFRASPLKPPLLPFRLRLRRRPLTFLSASPVELSGSRAGRPHVRAHPPRCLSRDSFPLASAKRPPPPSLPVRGLAPVIRSSSCWWPQPSQRCRDRT